MKRRQFLSTAAALALPAKTPAWEWRHYAGDLESSRYAPYPRTINRELTKLFNTAGFVTLRDMTADRVQQYLTGLGVKAATGMRAGTQSRHWAQ